MIRRRAKSKAERNAITVERIKCFERDNFQCVDCHKRVYWDDEFGWWNKGHAAHIVNASQGGKFVAENLLLKCPQCPKDEHDGAKPCPRKVIRGLIEAVLEM